MKRIQIKKPIVLASIIAISFISCQQKRADTHEAKADVSSTDSSSMVVDEKPIVKKIDTIGAIDVSHYQGDVDWDKIKESGIVLGIAKSTQGITYTDPLFTKNWAEIEESGLYRGSYHFYVAKDDPILQAKNYLSVMKSVGKHHIPAIVDLEGAGIDGLTIGEFQKNVLVWLKYVEDSLDMKPIIYTNNPFGSRYLNDESFAKYDLWIAEYGSDEAKIPAVWKAKGWTGWQFTQRDTILGVTGFVDKSRFLSTVLINDDHTNDQEQKAE